MAFIDEIRTERELIPMHVESWDKTVFFYPISLADSDYATKMAKGSDAKFIVYMIIRKLLDENGNQLFNIGNKVELMRDFDPDILSQIVIDMKGDDGGK